MEIIFLPSRLQNHKVMCDELSQQSNLREEEIVWLAIFKLIHSEKSTPRIQLPRCFNLEVLIVGRFFRLCMKIKYECKYST